MIGGMYMKAITNAKVVLENGIIWDGTIIIKNGKIVKVGKSSEIPIDGTTDVIDACGAYVGPGFVDIHVHGGNGFCTSFDTEQAANFFLQHGETTILATPCFEFNFDEFMDALRSIKTVMDSGKAKNVKGIYCEGPYTNANYGALADLNPWKNKVITQQYKAFVDEGGQYVKVWTIAPELEGIMGFVEYARKVNPNVIFSLGHSEAAPMEIRALGAYKPKILVHAMCATGRRPVFDFTRGYGPDEYCFKEPDMYAELISDSCGIHVHPELQQLLVHTKGYHRVILITDSTVYDEPAPENLKHIKDLCFDHNGTLAGSRLTMDCACRNIMSHTNCGIAQAFLMASTNPARVLGLDKEIGSVEIGKIADLVFVDDMFNVKQVMLGGEIQVF